MRKYRQICALVLLTVLTVVTIPDQLIHGLTGHHDTIEKISLQPNYQNQHLHCAALQYELNAFHEHTVFSIPSAAFTYQFSFNTYSFIFSSLQPASNSGRAPPALV